MAVLLSFHQVTLSLLIAAGIFAITGVATKAWFGNYSLWNLANEDWLIATKAFIVLGVVGVALALLMEILIQVSDTFRLSSAIRILCLIFVIVGFAGLLVGTCIYGTKGGCRTSCGFSYWFEVIATVLSFEAVAFYMVAWRCT